MTRAVGEGLGTDFRWVLADGVGDIDEDWSVEYDEAAAFTQAIIRRLMSLGLWYAATYGMDVRDYLLDIATDAQIQMEVQAQIQMDERTARSTVLVTRPVYTARDIACEVWSKRQRQPFKFTLQIADVDGKILLGLV